MSLNVELSEGALQIIMNGGSITDPIVQVLGSKKMIQSGKEIERHRLLLSDGKYKVSVGMYTVPANKQSDTQVLTMYAVIKLKRYLSNVIRSKDKDTRVLLILELELVASADSVGHEIGNPVILPEYDVTNSENASSSAPLSATPGIHPNSKAVCPIVSLNPFHNNWIIKARVVNKSNLRSWKNAKGEGKVFSVDLMDQNGEIRCTGFREVAEKFYNLMEVDRLYFISKCALQPINRQYCQLNHFFEMMFTENSVVKECFESNDDVPEIQYSFTTFDKLAVMMADTVVDVIGVCKSVSDLTHFTSKSSGRELTKREVLLVDQSRIAISLTLWGTDAESFAPEDNPVISIRRAKLSEFMSTKNISLSAGSYFKINPDFREAKNLRTWYDCEGYKIDFKNISARLGTGGGGTPWLTFKEVLRQDLSTGVYFQTYATILFIKADRTVYKSCPSTNCLKKVVDLENGMYKCAKCNREYAEFKYRFLLSMHIADCSASHWVTLFSSEAEKLIGRTAQELGEAMEREQDLVAKSCEEMHFKQFVFKCRAKLEDYNDERKVKVIVFSINDIDFEEHNGHLVKKLEELGGIPRN